MTQTTVQPVFASAGNSSTATQASASYAGGFTPSFNTTPTFNGLPQTPVSTQKSSVPVITSAGAQNDFSTKKAGFDDLKTTVQNQTSKIAADKAYTAEQQKILDDNKQLQDNVKAQNNLKQQEIDNKAKALTGTPTPSPTTAPAGGTTNGTNDTSIANKSGQDTIQNGLNSATNTLTSGLSDIQNAKDSLTNDINTKLSAVMSGTFPLTGTQQAMISSIQSQLNQNQYTQAVANASYTGSVTEAGFRKGGEYTPEQYAGAISNAVSYGVNKMQNLDNEAAKTMATLEVQFQKENYDEITKHYDILNKQLEDKSTALKDMYSAVTSSLKDQRDQEQKQIALKTAAEKDARDFEEKMNEFAANYNQKDKEFAANNSLDKAKLGLDQQKFSHQLEMDAATGVSSLDDAGLTMLAKGYLTSGTLPSLGYGKTAVAMRTAVINKAVNLSGGAENVNPAVNKAAYAANSAVLKSQQQAYTTASTAYNIFDKNGQLALSLAQGLNKSNSPIINQLDNSVINQTTGKGQLDSYKALITSLQGEYATLISVKGGSGQVTEADKAKATAAIPADISPNRLKDVLTNLKTEGQNVLDERKQTVDQLIKNISGNAQAFDSKTVDKPVMAQIITAKDAGYSPEEIVQGLQSNPQYSDIINRAISAGYSPQDIINSLSQ